MPETPETYVWVTDTRTGHAYPLDREAAEADPETFKVDADHPVRDREGRLLDTRYRTDKAPAPKAAKAATTTAKEA